jgi:hypothetical protein
LLPLTNAALPMPPMPPVALLLLPTTVAVQRAPLAMAVSLSPMAVAKERPGVTVLAVALLLAP